MSYLLFPLVVYIPVGHTSISFSGVSLGFLDWESRKRRCGFCLCS